MALSEAGASGAARTGALAFIARIAAWRTDASDRSTAQRTAGAAFIIRVASAGIMYLSQVLLARWMGRFEFGIYVYVWAWVGFLGMASTLGIATASQRLVPEYRTRGDLDGLRGYLAGGRVMGFGLGTAAGVLLAGCALALGDRIPTYYVIPFLIASLTLPIFTAGSVQDLMGRALNWIDLALLPGFIAHPLAILAVMSALHAAGFTVTAVTVLATACVAMWAMILVQSTLLSRRLRDKVPPGARRYEPLAWLKTALPLFFVDGFFLMLTNVDTLILQLFVGPADVAVYYAATKTLALVNFIYFAVGAACAHRFSEYHVAGDHDRLARFLADSIRWTFWPSLALVIVLLALGRPILSLFGPGFADGYPLIWVMMLGLLARAAVGPAERLLNMIGQQAICPRSTARLSRSISGSACC